MHVTLIVKPDAGGGDHSTDALEKKLRKHGHEVVTCLRSDDWKAALRKDTDLVLIGGGDGTVGKIARQLIGTDIPFAILPLGTANNVAHQLGWLGKAKKLVKRLDDGRYHPFDVGTAAGPWGSWRFIESVGIGPFARTMALLEHTAGTVVDDPDERKAALKRDLQMLDAQVLESHAEQCTIEVDGERIDERIILAEIMNIGRIGPNVHLAPDADTSDGLFDFVYATEADRDRIHEHIQARLDGEEIPLALRSMQARQVRLTVESARVHVDDVLWPDSDHPLPAAGTDFTIELSIDAGALTTLLPSVKD
jgi:diacylglycerol kinase (ATP)